MDDFDPFYGDGIDLGLGEGMDVEEDENNEDSMEEYENNLEAMKVEESDSMVEVLVDKGNMIDDVELMYFTVLQLMYFTASQLHNFCIMYFTVSNHRDSANIFRKSKVSSFLFFNFPDHWEVSEMWRAFKKRAEYRNAVFGGKEVKTKLEAVEKIKQETIGEWRIEENDKKWLRMSLIGRGSVEEDVEISEAGIEKESPAKAVEKPQGVEDHADSVFKMIGGRSKKSTATKAAHVQEVVSKTGPEEVKSREAQILEVIVEINKRNLEEGTVKSAYPYVLHSNNFEAQLRVNTENNPAYVENLEDLVGNDVDVVFL
ncbi:hypothetical protein L6452_42350 [Arctium lappa]|uniref:Uncharacterized protein n=1 Tax=Arctium lappa TaxID=4217 RepID=A0ACB8XI08_ARCLA|nr:hypothetical protein L6452_42350 [Arctium lappa]